MLSFIMRLFSKGTSLDQFKLFNPDLGQGVTTEKSNIHYYENLVDNFKEEHQLLLQYYSQVLQSLDEGNYNKAESRLSNFIKQLAHHIKSENTRLYVYLKDIHQHSPETLDYVMNMQKKMATIFGAVSNIRAKYISVDASNANNLKKDFSSLASIIKERIENEERSLYTLYKLPEQSSDKLSSR